MSPLTPADCDLKDFAYMPLDVARLRQSELTSDETPEACWAAVLLWCASWHEVPAGSIPNNDQWQAKQAGYVARGKIDKAWESVKAGALRGFVLCDDGRLYHPVVAEKARESWESKQRHAYGKMCERLRKLNKARAENNLEALPVPPLEQWISGGKVDPVPPEVDIPSAGIPPEKTLKGEGEGEGEGKGKGSKEKGENAPGGAPPPVPPKPEKPKTPRPQREQITLAVYLDACKASRIKPIPEDHHVKAWATDAGIVSEMMQIAWLLFRERYTADEKAKGKRYKDWPGHFANAVKGNWFKLWFIGDDGKPAWSTVGMTHKAALDARMAQKEAVHG